MPDEHPPGVARGSDAHGLDTVVLRDEAGAEATVYLHGAHVTSWRPAGGSEALFLSSRARFAPGEAIRGGIPVIFPQFAELGPLPKHGFARLRRWTVDDDGAASGEPSVTLLLDDDDETRARWPARFRARLTVALDAAHALRTELAVENRGDAPLEFTAALHTYLRVGDVREATVEGLRGSRFRESGGDVTSRDDDERLTGEAPVNRVYLDVPDPVIVHDRSLGRTFELRRDGLPDVVVWNPGEAGARAIPDLAEGEYRQMLCVEPAAVGAPVRLLPGAHWSGTQRLSIGRP